MLISDYQPSALLTYLMKLDTYTRGFSGYEECLVKARAMRNTMQ